MIAPTHTPTDAARWQVQNLSVLADVVDQGARAGLPALMWTVSPIGMLRGEVPADVASPGAAFAAWAAILGAPRTHSHIYAGRVSLRAHARRVFGTSVLVGLSARFDAVAEVTR